MKKLTMIFMLAFTASGCESTGGVGFADLRLDAPLGSPELTAACEERKTKGLLFNTATYIGGMITALPAAAIGDFAEQNPVTANYNAKCAANAGVRE